MKWATRVAAGLAVAAVVVRGTATQADDKPLMVVLDLTFLNAAMGRPVAGIIGFPMLHRCVAQIDMETPASVLAQGGTTLHSFEAGRQVVAQSGCLACHKIAENGGTLGPNLTKIGGRLAPQAIERTLINPTAPMPSYASMPPEKKAALVAFLSHLK